MNDGIIKADGSVVGPKRILNPPFNTSVTDDYLFFSTGKNLLATNGNEIVNEVFSGEYPGNVKSAGKYVLFTTGNSKGNYQLWKSDGTKEGTIKLKDIEDEPGQFVNQGVEYYFSTTALPTTNNSPHVSKIWKTNGTSEGTFPFKEDIYGFLVATIKADDITYFSINGTELWKTDGTAQGTELIKKIGDSRGYFKFPVLRPQQNLHNLLSHPLLYCLNKWINSRRLVKNSRHPNCRQTGTYQVRFKF